MRIAQCAQAVRSTAWTVAAYKPVPTSHSCLEAREVHTRVAAHAGAVCCVTICSVFVFCVLAASGNFFSN